MTLANELHKSLQSEQFMSTISHFHHYAYKSTLPIHETLCLAFSNSSPLFIFAILTCYLQITLNFPLFLLGNHAF